MDEVKEVKRKKKPVSVVYVSEGSYLAGIPAKDMSMKEWGAIPKDKREHALKLGLYEVKYG